jgi:hypothetical protein
VPTYLELSKQAQEQFLAAVGETQKVALQGAQLWAETVQAAPVATPAGIPTAEQLIDNSFLFVHSVLESQKAFAKELVSVLAPAAAAAAAKPAAAKA